MFSHLVTSVRRLLDSVLLSDFVLDLFVGAFLCLSAAPPLDLLLDLPSKVTPFVWRALYRTALFRSDRARAPIGVSGGHLLFSECCCGCGAARISLGICLCVRCRCVSYFPFFLTFVKRACSPSAVKNLKIPKNMKFLDVRKTIGITLILWCPDVVLLYYIFFFCFVITRCTNS